MAIVVKWRQDGAYLHCLYEENGAPVWTWTKRQRKARRFESKEGALAILRAHVGPILPDVVRFVRFVRLVPRKRHASPKP